MWSGRSSEVVLTGVNVKASDDSCYSSEQQLDRKGSGSDISVK
jgi:hypothetical protein